MKNPLPWALAALLASATVLARADDPERGKALYAARCGACHAVDTNRTGPMHAGLIGRRAGSLPGFAYSPALAQSRIIWTAETLDQWLRDPEALIPGQRMYFRVSDAGERQAIIDYLGTRR